MLDDTIDELLIQELGEEGYNREKDAVSEENFNKLVTYIKNNPDKQPIIFESLRINLEDTKDLFRRFGHPVLNHYETVRLEFLNPEDTSYENLRLFLDWAHHDSPEDKLEEEIKNTFLYMIKEIKFNKEILDERQGKKQKNFVVALDKLKKDKRWVKRVKEFEEPTLQERIEEYTETLKSAIHDKRGDIFYKFIERFKQAATHVRGIPKDFFDNVRDDLDFVVRYRLKDDNYSNYLVQLYSQSIHKPLIKWVDRFHNSHTLWPMDHEFVKNELSIDALTKKEAELRKLYDENKTEYFLEKDILHKQANLVARKYIEEKRKQGIKIKDNAFNPEWRIKNIGKDIIHIYMGKQFLKKHRKDPKYREMKKIYETFVKQVAEQAIRERLFQTVYNNNIGIPAINPIEKSFIKYLPEGLNMVEIPDDFGVNKAEKEGNGTHFEGTIAGEIESLMKGEIMKRIIITKSKPLDAKQLYTISLIHEATCLQNIKPINLVKYVKTQEDLINQRKKYYPTIPTSTVRMNYMLENFGKLTEKITEAGK